MTKATLEGHVTTHHSKGPGIYVQLTILVELTSGICHFLSTLTTWSSVNYYITIVILHWHI